MGQSIKQQLILAEAELYSISSSPKLDSEVLMAHCLGKDRSYLLTWPEKQLNTEQMKCFKDLIQRRLQPQPVAYLVGEREFYSMQLTTTPATLVPRPETEMLVDKVIDLVKKLQSPLILELGTGTGAIPLAIKQQLAHCQIIATDIDSEALSVAKTNADKHELEVEFIKSNWYQSCPQSYRFDVIVSNPPYIAAQDPYLCEGDLPAEPLQALSSGETGLEALQAIIEGATQYLKPKGWLVLEHGYDQQQSVSRLMVENSFKSVTTENDFNSLPRMTYGQS